MLAAMAAGSAAGAQADAIIVTGNQIETCASHPPSVAYSPEREFDGILFSTIDRFSFDPCRPGAACDRTMKLEMNDLHGSSAALQALRDAGFDQYGYYRVRFVGREGRWSRVGLDRSQDFTEVIRPISVILLPDR